MRRLDRFFFARMIHYKMVFLVEIRARTEKVLCKLGYIVQIYQIMTYTHQYKTGRPNRHIDVLDKKTIIRERGQYKV